MSSWEGLAIGLASALVTAVAGVLLLYRQFTGQLMAERARREGEIAALNSALDAERLKRRGLEEQAARAARDVEDLARQLAEAIEREQAKDILARNLEREQARLGAEHRALLTAYNQVAQELATIRPEAERLGARVGELERQIATLTHTIEAMQAERKQMEQIIAQKDARIAELERDRTAMQMEITRLRERGQHLEDENALLKQAVAPAAEAPEAEADKAGEAAAAP